jgi:cardiolipin synthase A/B
MNLPKNTMTVNKFKFAIWVIIGTLVVLLFALNFFNPQKDLDYKIESTDSVESEHFKLVLSTLLGPPIAAGNKVQSYYNGDQIFPAMLDAINSAKKTITFESYIYWSGDIGKKFADALSERAQAGVKVHVLIDWVGSQKIDATYIERMTNAGVEVEKYHELKWYNFFRMNNRTHRKILVVDGRIGFTGGVGIADEWTGNGLDPNRWRDTHFKVEGPAVQQMQAAFLDNWLKVRPEVHQSEDYFPQLDSVGQAWAQMFKSSSREGGSSVHIMYLLALNAAKKSIQIENAYFAPDKTTIDALVNARKRGVEVTLIVPSKLTDSQIVRHASREQWGPLLESGVKIYEYQKAKFHCKVLVIDSYFVSVGSTNFDERSFRLNDEANLNVLDSDLAANELRTFSQDIIHSKEVTLEDWKNRPVTEKLIEKTAALFRSQL